MPVKNGQIHPGGGCVVKTVEVACQKEAVVLGKPSKLAFDLIVRENNLQEIPKSKFLMVGDNLQTDIKFAEVN